MIKSAIGGTHVRLTLVEGSGGSIEIDAGIADMEIGVDDHWEGVMSTLLHESFELAMMMNNHRLQRESNPRLSDFCFYMEHNEFNRVCEEAGYFIAKVLPQLTADYNEIHGLRGKKKVGVV